jgi:phospholipase/carboxylesterase
VKIDPLQVLWSAPESERAGRPLLVMLHGHGSNETVGFEQRHRLPADLVLASVRAPMPANAGFAWFRLDPQVGVQQANSAAQAVLSWLDAQPPAPSVGILGVSQGAATGLQAMRLAPTRFAYAVNLSGFVVPGIMPGDAQLARSRPPVFWGRGDRDGVIPDFLVTLGRAWLAQHTRLDERVYPGLGHNVADAELTDLSNFIQAQIGTRSGGPSSS